MHHAVLAQLPLHGGPRCDSDDASSVAGSSVAGSSVPILKHKIKRKRGRWEIVSVNGHAASGVQLSPVAEDEDFDTRLRSRHACARVTQCGAACLVLLFLAVLLSVLPMRDADSPYAFLSVVQATLVHAAHAVSHRGGGRRCASWCDSLTKTAPHCSGCDATPAPWHAPTPPPSAPEARGKSAPEPPSRQSASRTQPPPAPPPPPLPRTRSQPPSAFPPPPTSLTGCGDLRLVANGSAACAR